ncbi:hypothetical protein [Salinibacterium sp. PAMC 21357]|uniref:hypothetical protein n=1 Tax=Salinibacterium sp. PAMC 21357 TaxID=1112215 RepID=UPI0002E1F9D8|nr:hypothetical protein [Salinibacterium sp. PAMC 21357]
MSALDVPLDDGEILNFVENLDHSSLQPEGTPEQRLRLSRFAAANGFEFAAHEGAVGYPGMIFGLGFDRAVSQHLVRSGEQFLDIGNYEYTARVGADAVRYRYGFVAIHLERRMPHLVLDSNTNNFLGASQLPVGFASKQRISLEGNFDEYFAMYCPKGYEPDALYVFTPDLMALMIDEAVIADAEVVDDWMFLYRFGGFDLSDPATMAMLFRIIDTVGAKMLTRTDRYSDSRLDPAVPLEGEPVGLPGASRMAANRVTPAGARLQRGMAPVLKLAVWLIIGLPVTYFIVVTVVAFLRYDG